MHLHPVMSESRESLQGVGMFDDQAGKDLRSDEQIREEVHYILEQMLRVHHDDTTRFPVKVEVKRGEVELIGELPDRGTRRLVIQACGDIPSVRRVECKRLLPTSLLD